MLFRSRRFHVSVCIGGGEKEGEEIDTGRERARGWNEREKAKRARESCFLESEERDSSAQDPPCSLVPRSRDWDL